MNSTRIFIIAIVLTALSFGCKDDPYLSATIDSVKGDWVWVKSTTENWLGKQVITPDSVDYTRSLIVKSDTIEFLTDGNLVYRSYYQSYNEEKKLIIDIDNSSILAYFIKDTLVFNQAAHDGPVEYFIKSSSLPDPIFEAEVIGNNQDCGLPAIKFHKNIYQANIIAETNTNWSTFIAHNLPEEQNSAGLIIIVKVRKIKDSELGICAAMGPSYPWLHILEASKKE